MIGTDRRDIYHTNQPHDMSADPVTRKLSEQASKRPRKCWWRRLVEWFKPKRVRKRPAKKIRVRK